MMTKKIIAIGYIPKAKGGKQFTGLATGIFDLHDAVNKFESKYQVVIAATDIHHTEIKIDNTKVVGWNKKLLLKHILIHPIRIIYFIIKTLSVIKFRKVFSPINILAKLIFIDYSIEKEKPDLIHFHGSSGALLSIGLWNKKQKKILRLHGINGYDTSIAFFSINRKIEKYITSLNFEKVTFVTNGILKEWGEKYGKFSCKMIPILNGYNAEIFQPQMSTNEIIRQYDLITFSAVSNRKGQIRVIEAINQLKKEGINLSYLIIGNGNKNYIDDLKKIVALDSLNVTFIEYLSQREIISYLHQSKYFILPSITEGFGKVYIESIGAGIPVIIPEHLPLAQISGLLNKTNSIIINDSSTESITVGLKNILNTKNSNFDISTTVEKLRWEILASQYLKIYDSIFENK